MIGLNFLSFLPIPYHDPHQRLDGLYQCEVREPGDEAEKPSQVGQQGAVGEEQGLVKLLGGQIDLEFRSCRTAIGIITTLGLLKLILHLVAGGQAVTICKIRQ